MGIVDDLLRSVPDGAVETVVIGLHWTAVSARVNGLRLCGLSSTVRSSQPHGEGPDVPDAGRLTRLSASELAGFCRSEKPALASVGAAALNALLQVNQPAFIEVNAEELILKHGSGRRVAIVGHFPFTSRVRETASHLDVLEKTPQPGDLPTSLAPEVIPLANVVAITGMAFVNHTLEDLLALCSPQALIIILGASTPLHPVLFRYGIDYLCGALPTDIDGVLRATAEGAVYRQIMRAGLRLVSVQNSGKKR